jgi:isopenicillin-N epimerase
MSLRAEFLLDPDVVFLNHGSFGACPRPVFERYQAWQLELERQPVEFLGRRLEGLLAEARARLAAYLGARPDDLVFVPNATSAVNVAARALRLQAGDEVLATDLEYGACDLVWEHVCGRAGARYVRAPIRLPLPAASPVVEQLFAHVSERTRAVFFSHVTSATALILPVAEIVRRARLRGLVTIVDGAHAPGHVPLDLDALGADYYAGTCHKWLCAPKGAGFLHARRELQDTVEALVVSWGFGPDGTFLSRNENQGTRDPAAYLSVPAAIDWQEEHGWDAVRERCHGLAVRAQAKVAEIAGTAPLSPPCLFGQMVSVPVPTSEPEELQRRLLHEHRIEVPVHARTIVPLLRVSFQGYNDEGDLERLVGALRQLLPGLEHVAV